MTDELAQAFMDTESESEFEGFSAEESDWRKPVVNMTKNTTYSYDESSLGISAQFGLKEQFAQMC